MLPKANNCKCQNTCPFRTNEPCTNYDRRIKFPGKTKPAGDPTDKVAMASNSNFTPNNNGAKCVIQDSTTENNS